jgi:N-acylneuraminate cytidylyltransferase
VRDFAGRPLLAYTIDAAIESGLFQRVAVTTDSEAIAEIACRYGAEVPFLRAEKLANDYSPVSVATIDALNRLDPNGQEYWCVAQLMATCPLRNAEDVRRSHLQFVTTGTDSQLSVTRFGWQNPWWAVSRDESYTLQPFFKERITARSQDLPNIFCPTGAVWWAKADVLRREGTFHTTGRTGWEIPWQRGVDIDTEDDWHMAEVLYRLTANEGCVSNGR